MRIIKLSHNLLIGQKIQQRTASDYYAFWHQYPHAFFYVLVLIVLNSFTLGAATSQQLSDSLTNNSIDFSKLIPLGNNSRTSLYWDGNYMIYGKDGTNIFIGDIIPDSIEDGRMFLMQDTIGVISSFIEADSIYGSGSLVFKTVLPTKTISYIIDRVDSIVIDDICYFVNINDIPIGTPFRKNVLSYVSTTLNLLSSVIVDEVFGESSDDIEDKPSFNLFVPDENTAVQDIEDYYAYWFYECCSEWCKWDDEPYNPLLFRYVFEKAIESEHFVTYQEVYALRAGLGTMWNYGTGLYVTFDKNSGKIVTLEDIFDNKYECLLANLLRESIIAQDINMMSAEVTFGNIALVQDGLVFCYEPGEIEQHNTILFVSHENLEGMLKLDEACFYDFKSIFHEVAISHNNEDDDDIFYWPYQKDTYQSHIQAKDRFRIVENPLPASSLWEIGYGCENVPINKLVSYRDSILQDGEERKVAIVNKLIEKRIEEIRVDSILNSGDYSDLFKEDWETKSYSKAVHFVEEKEWDMAIEHLYISLAFLLNEDDTHDYYSIPQSINDYRLDQEGINGGSLYVDCVTLLGDIFVAIDEMDSAVGYYKRASNVLNKLLAKKFRESISQNRGKLWDRYSAWYMNYLPEIAYKSKDDTLRIAAYNAALMGKELKLNTERAECKAIYESNNPTLINLLKTEDNLKIKLLEISDSIKYYTNQLNHFHGGKSDTINNKIDSLKNVRTTITDKLNVIIDDKYKQLNKLWGYQKIFDVKLEDLRSVLNDDELAIEFACGYNGKDTTYYAMCIKKEIQVPVIIKLFNQSRLPELESSSQDLKKLYHLVWKPLKKQLEGVKKVYFSASDHLNDFSIEYALNSSNLQMNLLYDVYRLSSTRILYIRRNEQSLNSFPKTAALFGGLTYDIDDGFLDRDRKRFTDLDRGMDAIIMSNHSIQSDYTINKKKHFTYLPGTKQEVEDIKKVADETKLFQDVSVYRDTIGTENLLKSLSGKDLKLLHIATHGGVDLNIDSLEEQTGDIDDKLLRGAYLALSGANSNSGKDASCDGLADGLEISGINLLDLDLVVLSACESGRGGLTQDGMVGLQSAFKKAGAKTLMMSLRRIHDDATRLLMTNFYSNIASGMTKIEALSKAQQFLKNYNQGIYSSPYYWANFILLDAL